MRPISPSPYTVNYPKSMNFGCFWSQKLLSTQIYHLQRLLGCVLDISAMLISYFENNSLIYILVFTWIWDLHKCTLYYFRPSPCRNPCTVAHNSIHHCMGYCYCTVQWSEVMNGYWLAGKGHIRTQYQTRLMNAYFMIWCENEENFQILVEKQTKIEQPYDQKVWKYPGKI